MDDIKKLEGNAYSRGYAAGVKRVKNEEKVKRNNRREEFFDKAFIAAIPFSMQQESWSFGPNAPVKSIEDRMELARRVAQHATKVRFS